MTNRMTRLCNSVLIKFVFILNRCLKYYKLKLIKSNIIREKKLQDIVTKKSSQHNNLTLNIYVNIHYYTQISCWCSGKASTWGRFVQGSILAALFFQISS